MSNTKYDAIWVPGSFFEKGHWKLTPSTGGGGLGALIFLVLMIFILCVIILVSPLIISLIGFSLIKGKRYYASIFSFLALMYLFIDYQKEWITSFIIFGTKQENFTNGLLGIKYAPHFFLINTVAFGISIYFIVSSCFINLQKSNDDLNYIDQDKNIISIIVGILSSIICFFCINNYKNSSFNQQEKVAVSKPIIEKNSNISDDNYNSGLSSYVFGNQDWQLKNLDVSTFRNGDIILEAESKEEWENASKNHIPAWCSDNGYGKLYNWYAVIDERGLAPDGFHIPNNKEVWELFNFFGCDQFADVQKKSDFATVLYNKLLLPRLDFRYDFGSFSENKEKDASLLWTIDGWKDSDNEYHPSEWGVWNGFATGPGASSYDAGCGLFVRCIKGEKPLPDNSINETSSNQTEISNSNNDISSQSVQDFMNGYYQDICNNNFDVNTYFSNNVNQFITLKNTTSDIINYQINNVAKNEFRNSKISIISDVEEVNSDSNDGSRYFTFSILFDAFRVSKNKNTSCNVDIEVGVNSEFKIVSYRELKYYNYKFF
jgi:uncharacterized protein (TIGR02145 family)